MNKNSKNNYSKKNRNKLKKNSDAKNFSKYNKYLKDKDFSSKNSNASSKELRNDIYLNKAKSGDKKEENFISSKNKKNFNKINNIFSSRRTEKISDNLSNKKNFDDWIWGKHSVHSALTSERAINRIWCTAEIYSSEKFYTILKDLKSKGVLIEEVSWNRISQLTFGATHQGIAMQIAHAKSISLSELITLSKTHSSNPIILALDGITDPHNLGAIIRSAEAFGCGGIILPQRRSAGLTGTVAKVAAGALEYIPVSRVVNLNRALEELKRNSFVIAGLMGDGKFSISEFNEKTPLVVIIGAEDKGISLLVQKKCDYLLKIPLKGKTSSLNASVAAAISLFHLSKI